MSKRILEDVFPDGERPDTDAVECSIKQFASVDRSGERSRYPETLEGDPSFPEPLQLNLRNMRDVVSRLDGFLSGCYDALDDLNRHDPADEC